MDSSGIFRLGLPMPAGRLPERQGAGGDDINHFAGAGLLQCPGEFIQRRAGGHDVINYNNTFPGKRPPAAKSAMDISPSLCQWQFRLQPGLAMSFHGKR